MVDSGRETADSRVQWVFYLDDDDLVSRQMAEELDREAGDVVFKIGPRILLSSMWNECFSIADHDVLQHSCDETIYRTAGWDTAVLEAFQEWPDGIGLVYGRDGIHDERLATHGFITRDWVEAVGYFVPPYFSSDYNDLWLHEVAGSIGRRVFLPDVFTEHMHPAVGKGPLDQTHQDRLTRHSQDGVDGLWNQLLPKRQEDVVKLMTAMQRFQVGA
jgi:hypothetical protein